MFKVAQTMHLPHTQAADTAAVLCPFTESLKHYSGANKLFDPVLGSPSASPRPVNFKQDTLMNCWIFLKKKKQNQINPANSKNINTDEIRTTDFNFVKHEQYPS